MTLRMLEPRFPRQPSTGRIDGVGLKRFPERGRRIRVPGPARPGATPASSESDDTRPTAAYAPGQRIALSGSPHSLSWRPGGTPTRLGRFRGVGPSPKLVELEETRRERWSRESLRSDGLQGEGAEARRLDGSPVARPCPEGWCPGQREKFAAKPVELDHASAYASVRGNGCACACRPSTRAKLRRGRATLPRRPPPRLPLD